MTSVLDLTPAEQLAEAAALPERLLELAEELSAVLDAALQENIKLAWPLERLAEKARILADEADEAYNGVIEYDRSVSHLHVDTRIDPHGDYVYILWGAREPIYVGQSTNILGRLGQHMDPRYEKRAVTEFVELIPCASKDEALLLESVLIARYRPPLNVHKNPDAKTVKT